MPKKKDPKATEIIVKRGYMSGVDVHVTLSDGKRCVISTDALAHLALAELNRRRFFPTKEPSQKLHRLYIPSK